ncbi:hypothetical protein COCON_G00160540 [Conger conger]|uniref:Anion exchange protein n=1 Tax=Conger conger TaxID=82655 RepID=A0A9Q1D9Z2_CONCO|nr:hypothetical protein COCON_G00160540 [Conger conger]
MKYWCARGEQSAVVSPAAERLRYILCDEDDEPTPTLFTQMDTLQHEADGLEWKESARWVKFEEKVEEGGERWSKPHVSTLSLHSLFELRTCLQEGTVLLDLEGYSLPQIVDDVIERQVEEGLLEPESREKIAYVLLRKHRHQTKKPIHRSLADMGKPSGSSECCSPPGPSPARPLPAETSLSVTVARRGSWSCKLGDTGSGGRSQSVSPAVGAGYNRSSEDLHMKQGGGYGRLRHAQSRSMNDIADTPSEEQLKNKFMKKIPPDAEASNVLVGEVDFLDKPFVAFVRLDQATTLGGLTEVPVPTRFLFMLLGPPGRAKSYNEIGRAIATLMVDDLFSDVAYKARDREDLIAGIDEFLNQVIVLPPGEWDPNIRIEPPKKVLSADKRKTIFSLQELGQMNGAAGSGGRVSEDEEMPVAHEPGEELAYTGRFCGGLILDLKRKLPWFPSDFYDGLHIQSVSAVLFIYLGCITNAITFGGLLGDATENYQGVMESFLGTALTGTIFCLLGGQPLVILSSTGPILVFEKLLYEFSNVSTLCCVSTLRQSVGLSLSRSNGLDYMELRLWIGLHSCIQCLLLVATDASYIIKYITRFTEEGFSSLISFIFISDALKKMLAAFAYYPINSDFKPDYVTFYKCECLPPDPVAPTIFDVSASVVPDNSTSLSMSNTTAPDWTQLGNKDCLMSGGSLVGKSCGFVPDLALMSFILFFGTYSMAVSLKKFKFTRYFPTKLRKLISDFSIFMSIMTFVGLDMYMGLKTPKLIVPSEFKPTRPDRGWVVTPFGKNPWWMYLASFVPALLATILIFMDQQISAVIVNRKENKLKKGCGYHLDLFWVGILIAGCSFMGLPWYVAATVISIAHIDSLRMESESSAPGEQPQFLGVREQRLTGILVFVLTGVSIFLAPILQFIPMPVLYGVFLYMGVASLSGIQFWDRIKLYMMPAKHQPDYSYLRHVPLRRVHLFTLVQVVCLAVLWILKSTVAAIVFPVMILGLMGVRKMLDRVFSQHDLAWMDDILPEKDKKKDEEKEKKKKEKKPKGGEDGEEEVRDDDGRCEGSFSGVTTSPRAASGRVSSSPTFKQEKIHPYSNCSPGALDADRSITLHLKISCPPSPATPLSQGMSCPMPQLKIKMDSSYDDTDSDHRRRDRSGETTL